MEMWSDPTYITYNYRNAPHIKNSFVYPCDEQNRYNNEIKGKNKR